MHKKHLALIIAAIFVNSSYTMDNQEISLPSISQKHKDYFGGLLQKDMELTSLQKKTLSAELTDSKKCLYSSLVGAGICAIACVLPEDIKFKAMGMGGTIFAATWGVAMATMYDEKIKTQLYTQDQTKLSISIQESKKLSQEFRQETNSSGQIQQSVNITTSSTTKQKIDLHENVIEAFNGDYDRILKDLEEFTMQYSPRKICFYTSLAGILLCAIAWLAANNKGPEVAGMGSVLLLGASIIGIASGINEQQQLKDLIDTKINTRESIMQINRS